MHSLQLIVGTPTVSPVEMIASTTTEATTTEWVNPTATTTTDATTTTTADATTTPENKIITEAPIQTTTTTTATTSVTEPPPPNRYVLVSFSCSFQMSLRLSIRQCMYSSHCVMLFFNTFFQCNDHGNNSGSNGSGSIWNAICVRERLVFYRFTTGHNGTLFLKSLDGA